MDFSLSDISLAAFAEPTRCSAPDDRQWVRGWHGLFQLRESFSEKALALHQAMFDADPYHPFALEAFCLCGALRTMAGRSITFMELGSGRAPWCLAVASAVIHKAFEPGPKAYCVFAVEAEPTHYRWSRDHLACQKLSGAAVHAAIGREDGVCRFDASTSPEAHMGQRVDACGNIEVPMITIDTLAKRYDLANIDMIHMDIQGAEVDAILGARNCLKRGLIEYMIVGTHSAENEATLRSLLQPTHNLLLELPRNACGRFDGLPRAVCSTDDGVQVYRRRSS